MKKIYALLAGALLTVSVTVNAQTTPRVVLLEEFTGENCGPCAGINPYLDKYIASHATDSFIHIAYQSPIPTAGPIYNAYKTVTNTRLTYYNVGFAPAGWLDGGVFSPVQGPTSGTNSVVNAMQFFFDTTSIHYMSNSYGTAAGVATSTPTSPAFSQRKTVNSPCAITVTHNYSANNDSLYATAIVNTTFDFHAGTHNSLKFRFALIENQLDYLNAPGTNGETHFEQVVRGMYPNAAGTQLVDTLLNGRSDTFHFAVKIGNYVRERSQLRFVGWVQDDSNKDIKQSGISTLVTPTSLLEVYADHDSLPKFTCSNTNTSSSSAFVTVKNSGNVAITSLDVNVLSGGTSLHQFTWSNTLAPGATAVIDAGPIAIPVGNGYPVVTFVISKPNNQNNFSVSIFDTVKSQTQIFGASFPAPIVQSFEDTTTYPENYEATAGEGDHADIWYPSYYWAYYYSAYHNGTYPNQTPLGSDGYNSIYAWNYFDTVGTVSNYFLEKADFTGFQKAQMTFTHAYRQYDLGGGSLTNDMVEVQASTDCGTTWNTVWGKSGTALATVAAVAGSSPGYGPTSAADWVNDTVNLNTYANQNNVWLRFHSTSDWGDNAFIDQINITRSQALGINDVANVGNISVYPSPANDNLSLELNVIQSAAFDITIINTLGEVVKNVSNGDLGAGAHKMDVNVSDLAAGIYNVVISSNNQKTLKRFVAAH
jgi:hypothetical protein